ncbi:MAG TPA: hypothetical protein VKU19_18830 [Bryobacteraceae bacterium]|nr:hypothetical protein [Bryobacteraceae bacterium]
MQRPDPRPPVRDLTGGSGGSGGGGAVRPSPPSGGSGGTYGTGPTGGTGGGSGTGPTPKTGMSGGTKGKLLGVAALGIAAILWLKPAADPHYTGPPEEASPHYNDNKNSNPNMPAILPARDIDRKRTMEAQQAAQRGDPIPGITNPSRALIDAIKNGKVTFYAVRAYDTCAEDGDVVTLKLPSGGEIGPIPLTIAGTVVSIPVVEGQPASVTVVGVKDGVGGITLGVQSSGGTWFSKVMAVGESETMPLSIQ